MMNEEVRRIMTKDHLVASPNQTIKEVTSLMLDNKMQQIPVVSKGKLVGLITSYDLWRKTNNTGPVDTQH